MSEKSENLWACREPKDVCSVKISWFVELPIKNEKSNSEQKQEENCSSMQL
jgi:hypothetical protein